MAFAFHCKYLVIPRETPFGCKWVCGALGANPLEESRLQEQLRLLQEGLRETRLTWPGKTRQGSLADGGNGPWWEWPALEQGLRGSVWNRIHELTFICSVHHPK